MAQIIKVTGEEIQVTPKNGTDFQLKELQKIVGGYIEIVRLNGSAIMVVNEEDLLMGLPVNSKATSRAGQRIVGDVLICHTRQVR